MTKMTGCQCRFWERKSNDSLREPGTPPVADNTVGMARTPSAMIVFNMMIVALILVIRDAIVSRDTSTYQPTDL
jgi:hypothetical protein